MNALPARTAEARPTRVRPRSTLVGAALGLLLGAAVHVTSPALHSSSAVLELTEIAPLVDIAPRGGTVDRLAVDTDAQILRSDLVVGPVAAVVGESPQTTRAALALSARPLSRVLEVRFSHEDAEVARRGADVAANSFLEERERLIVTPVRAYLQALQSAAQAPIAGGNGRGDRFSEAARLEELRQRAVVAELQLAEAGRISQAPRLSTQPRRGDLEVPLASGAASGALLATAGQLLRSRLATRAQPRLRPSRSHPRPALEPMPAASS